MKIYLVDRKVNWQLLLIQLFACLLIFLFEYLGFLQLIDLLSERLLIPLQKASVQLVHYSILPFQLVRKSYKSARRIQDLESRYSEALAQLGELEKLKLENQELKSIINNTDQGLEKKIISTPILSLANPAIAVGSAEGVREGSIVTSKGTLLGIVSKVNEHHSLVTLLHQKNSQAILVKTESGVQGLVKGNGRQILLTEVPPDESLQPGERVLTLGQAGIEKDIFVGKISLVRFEPAESVKTAVVEQYQNFYEIVFVEVIL